MSRAFIFNRTEDVRALLAGQKRKHRIPVSPELLKPLQLSRDGEGLFVVGESSSGDVRRYRAPYRTGDVAPIQEPFRELPEGGYEYRADTRGGTGWKRAEQMPQDAVRLWARVGIINFDKLQAPFFKGQETVNELRAEGIPVNCDGCAGEESLSGQYRKCMSCPKLDNGRKEYAQRWNADLRADSRLVLCWERNPYVWDIQFELCRPPKEKGKD